jgi:DNA-binding transcriptional regulator GbsR (MarR family)
VTHASEPRADDAVRWFVEQFALLLADSGLPRMAARVFAYLLAGDREKHTVGQVAAGLGMSPAAVSGAVRHLSQAGLVIKDREPGASADSYRVYEDAWQVIAVRTVDSVDRAVDVLSASVERLDQETAAVSDGVREALEFYRFWSGELPATMERWREHRRTVLGRQTSAARA